MLSERGEVMRPKRKNPAEWVTLSKEEILEIVRKLARKGVPPSKIGLILRDQYGVPSFRAQTGMKLMTFLRRENLYKAFPEDLLSLLRKAVNMHEHLKEHRKDIHNRVRYEHLVSQINTLLRYYKKKGLVPKDWKYSPEAASLLVKG